MAFLAWLNELRARAPVQSHPLAAHTNRGSGFLGTKPTWKLCWWCFASCHFLLSPHFTREPPSRTEHLVPGQVYCLVWKERAQLSTQEQNPSPTIQLVPPGMAEVVAALFGMGSIQKWMDLLLPEDLKGFCLLHQLWSVSLPQCHGHEGLKLQGFVSAIFKVMLLLPLI